MCFVNFQTLQLKRTSFGKSLDGYAYIACTTLNTMAGYFVLGSKEAPVSTGVLVKPVAMMATMICFSASAKFQSKIGYSSRIGAIPFWLSMN